MAMWITFTTISPFIDVLLPVSLHGCIVQYTTPGNFWVSLQVQTNHVPPSTLHVIHRGLIRLRWGYRYLVMGVILPRPRSLGSVLIWRQPFPYLFMPCSSWHKIHFHASGSARRLTIAAFRSTASVYNTLYQSLSPVFLMKTIISISHDICGLCHMYWMLVFPPKPRAIRCSLPDIISIWALVNTISTVRHVTKVCCTDYNTSISYRNQCDID